MNSGEDSPRSAFDIPAALIAAGIGTGATTPGRRLIRAPSSPNSKIVEFYSSRVATRLLAMQRDSANDRVHTALLEAGLPMLPRYDVDAEGLSFLYVPLGTIPLRNRLHLLHRDPAYADLLTMVAATQRAQYERGLGVFVPTDDVPLLDHFAFTPDSRSPTGQQLYLVPPYELNPSGTPEEFGTRLLEELRQSSHFDEAQLSYLQTRIELGVANDGQS